MLEYNVRLGDPEAEVVLPRLADDPFDLFEAVATGTLRRGAAVHLGRRGDRRARRGRLPGERVVDGRDDPRARRGRPARGAPRRRRRLPRRRRAGSATTSSTAGGRVLAVTALAPTVAAARTRAYEAVDQLAFEGCQVRRDIARRDRGGAA